MDCAVLQNVCGEKNEKFYPKNATNGGPGRAKSQKCALGANYTRFEREMCPKHENDVIKILNIELFQ